MKQSPEEKILYELEYFGIPTRNYSLKEAQELVAGGKLSQEEVDQACAKYQARIDGENTQKYGTPNPTMQQRMEHSFNVIDRLKKVVQEADVPANFVQTTSFLTGLCSTSNLTNPVFSKIKKSYYLDN